MKILLVSDNDNLESFAEYQRIDRDIVIDKMRFNQLEHQKEQNYDLAIMHFPPYAAEKGREIAWFKLKMRNKFPVLAIVEQASSREILTFLNYGADDYLTLPCEAIEIADKVTKLIREKRVMKMIENS